MVSGWAVPVRVGSKVLAVLEFYCHFRLREDPEVMASLETAAASLGQMLARSHERGRAEELSRQQEILLDSVADGICGVDRRGLVSFVNPAAARMLAPSPPTSPANRSITCSMEPPSPAASANPIASSAALRRTIMPRPAKIPSSAATAAPSLLNTYSPHPRSGPHFRFRAQLSRYQPALCSRSP